MCAALEVLDLQEEFTQAILCGYEFQSFHILNAKTSLVERFRITKSFVLMTHQGTCYGDSGGPLVTGSKTTAVQQGVVSFGSADGCATAPSAFARVSYFRSWILAKTNHVVSTNCASCATDAEWKSLCQSIGGTYDRNANGYQCKNLDVDKTQELSFAWSDCENNLVQNLCEKIGRYTCRGGEATCTPL